MQENKLQELFGPYIDELVEVIRQGSYNYVLPEIDTPIETILSMVAKTSNSYGKMARLAGIARANAKIARGSFERKYKRARGQGRNDKERDALAMETCADEHANAITAEALAEVAEAWESSLRVASESARKILDKAQAMQIASAREEHGAYKESDFQPY